MGTSYHFCLVAVNPHSPKVQFCTCLGAPYLKGPYCTNHHKNTPFTQNTCDISRNYGEIFTCKYLKNNIPLRFRKAGRVWCGGTRETYGATHPLSAVVLGLREIFGCRPDFWCSSNWPETFFEIWPLKWNMTPQSNTFALFFKKWLCFSQLRFKRLNFVQIFLSNLKKSTEVILGHLGAYGVKFRTSPKVHKLHFKMKLLVKTSQKKLIPGSKKVIKGQKSRKKA